MVRLVRLVVLLTLTAALAGLLTAAITRQTGPAEKLVLAALAVLLLRIAVRVRRVA